MKKPVQSNVTDTIGVDDLVTMDEATLKSYQKRISENSKDRNFLSPPSDKNSPVGLPNHQLRQITDLSSSSMKISHKYEYPRYLTRNPFSMDNIEGDGGSIRCDEGD